MRARFLGVAVALACAVVACGPAGNTARPTTIDVAPTAGYTPSVAPASGAATDAGTAPAPRSVPITRLADLVRLNPNEGTFLVEAEVSGPASECSPCRDVDCATVMCTNRWTLSDPDDATKPNVKAKFSVAIPPAGARIRFRVRPSARGVKPGVIPSGSGPAGDAPRPEGLVVECVEALSATTCE